MYSVASVVTIERRKYNTRKEESKHYEKNHNNFGQKSKFNDIVIGTHARIFKTRSIYFISH